MYVVQCVCLRRDKFTPDEAMAWIREHGYSANNITITPEHFLFRQVERDRLRVGTLRRVGLGDIGSLLVVYF